MFQKHNNDIVIKRFGDTAFSSEDVHRLVDEAWQRWFDAGLDSVWFHTSEERFARTMKSRVVFVAVDSETGELLGCHFLRPDRQRHCLFGSYLAVAPKAQGRGIATRLLEHEATLAAEHGYTYVQESTATTATWSIRWHQKNGYRIIGYQRRPQDNHPLYVFRRQLLPPSLRRPLYSFYSLPLFCRLHFFISYIATRLFKDSRGHLNWLGRMAKRVFGRR